MPLGFVILAAMSGAAATMPVAAPGPDTTQRAKAAEALARMRARAPQSVDRSGRLRPSLTELHRRAYGTQSAADRAAQRDLLAALTAADAIPSAQAHLFIRCGGGICETSFVEAARTSAAKPDLRLERLSNTAWSRCHKQPSPMIKGGAGQGMAVSMFCAY